MNGCAIPYTPIAVDFWKVRQSPRIKLFFASHAHMDSSSGLTHTWSKSIYCSSITKKLLIYRLSVKADIIHELEINVPNIINLNEDEKMVVTCFDANHYPGSVMFLFEGYFGRILYTGDFRYRDEMFGACMKSLLSTPVDVLYLDNNYCNPKCLFPSKSDCVAQIINLIKNNYRSKIILGMNALGKEDLLYFLSNYFNCSIKVNEDRLKLQSILYENNKTSIYSQTSNTPNIEVITLNELDNAIKHINESYIVIIPTAAFMISADYQLFKNRPFIHMIPYSGHSSYTELVHFVSKIRPRTVIPITKPVFSEPYVSALIDRYNLDCFQTFMDKSPKHHYHIPKSILEIMNQNSKRSKKRRNIPLEIVTDLVIAKRSTPNTNKNDILNEKTDLLTCKKQSSIVKCFRPFKKENEINIKKCLSAEHLTKATCSYLFRTKSTEFKNRKLKIDCVVNCPRSNLKRCHRARLCSPSRCQTVCRHHDDIDEFIYQQQSKRKMLSTNEAFLKVNISCNFNQPTSSSNLVESKSSFETIDKNDAITAVTINKEENIVSGAALSDNANNTNSIEKWIYTAPKKQWRDKFINT
ncbi:hypothetical protein HELRODRAFT_188648 [Helobdella robusta]|uniref:5' exonuclease Apollo n=1 Tax=Helobdella robusta TaxID=6412 RepID=T1FQ79_HELRO|nr:hypothetical protein HELRODRAFT_188648 [Helobdella robusta]ESO02275.1 hypothetical protein HELRODRAFT_188648 [Helobdella robusta]